MSEMFNYPKAMVEARKQGNVEEYVKLLEEALFIYSELFHYATDVMEWEDSDQIYWDGRDDAIDDEWFGYHSPFRRDVVKRIEQRGYDLW